MLNRQQVAVAAAQLSADSTAHTVCCTVLLYKRFAVLHILSRYAKLTLLTTIDTLGCSSLQLPPPHVLSNGSKAIMMFLSFMLSGATGTTLDLSLQQLTTLPAACANTALVALKLVGNNLRCIPVEFGR